MTETIVNGCACHSEVPLISHWPELHPRFYTHRLWQCSLIALVKYIVTSIFLIPTPAVTGNLYLTFGMVCTILRWKQFESADRAGDCPRFYFSLQGMLLFGVGFKSVLFAMWMLLTCLFDTVVAIQSYVTDITFSTLTFMFSGNQSYNL